MAVKALAYAAGIVVAPLAFLTDLSVGYALVPWACETQHHAVLHAVSAIALAIALAAVALGWREWKRDGGSAREDAPAQQPRFLAQLAVAIAALFSVAIAGMWFTQWVLGPCL